jgi:4,5-DOPA dioxygenase extradiol
MDRLTFLQSLGLLSLLPFSNAFKTLGLLIDQLKSSPKMPVLFLGHGSPMNALEQNIFSNEWAELGRNIPKPAAVLCISAHWLTRGTRITAMEAPKTIHDFGGFPKALFEVQYPAPGSPALAKETRQLITYTEVVEDHDWGLDHGTWSVVKHMYPNADIPVLQLSIDYHRKGEWHFGLGKALAKLRENGVLIIGSGNIVHNLRAADFSKVNEIGYGYDWAIEAHTKINQMLNDRNFKELTNYEKLGKDISKAVPTPDHYYPLLYILGLATEKEPLKIFNDHLIAGSLSMTSIQFG